MEMADVVTGFKLGAVDYVTKPFNSSGLVARVRTQLRLKKDSDIIARQSREQKELLHVLCHELANHVGAIQSLLEMADSSEDLTAFKPDLLMVVGQAIEVINFVRELRALEEGKKKLKKQKVYLKILIAESEAVLCAKVQLKGISLRVDIPAGQILWAEPVSLANSIFNNILTNAIKFSRRGAAIDLKAVKEDGHAVISIRDYGIGIPDPILKGLFELSKPTSRPGTEGEPGIGFGMPLIKKFIELNSGSIQVNCREEKLFPEDHGTEVLVQFPLAM
jgi:two-component system sensor histidine kinase/response regulator